jgi:adhesin transport system membrane fusion protein
MWKGRFKEQTAELLQQYSESVSFDWRLWRHDIEGSIAHSAALEKAGLITPEERSRIVDGLREIGAEIERQSLASGGDTDRLVRTDVRAPVSGTVNRLHFNTIGGVVKSGEAIVEITPTGGPLAVEARVRPDDRAALRAGLPTRVMIGAYDYAVYGALDGGVVEVSSDTLPDERGGRYYRVTIEVERAQGALAKEVILPGMTARADIVLGQRSVLSYLVSPLLKFASQALREPR